MASKYAIIGITLAWVAVTAWASMDSYPITENPIEKEIVKLSMSPGERMITQVYEHHPFVLISNWITE